MGHFLEDSKHMVQCEWLLQYMEAASPENFEKTEDVGREAKLGKMIVICLLDIKVTCLL